MGVDYYERLGVPPGASAEDIDRAYRRLARQFHPDRGGTHEQMLLINEAWEILSNPETRRRYDDARANATSPERQAAAGEDARRARQRAEEYPRKWADFEAWLARVADDFARATYGGVPIHRDIKDITFPTAGGSLSGWLFILTGAIVAGVVVGPLLHDLVDRIGLFKFRHPRLLVVIWVAIIGAPVLGGAWGGMALHRFISSEIKRQREMRGQQAASASTGSHLLLSCEKCGQKLRLPRMDAELAVTCPACGHKFSHRPGPP